VGDSGVEDNPVELQNILLPVDVAKCPLGVFDLVNRLARSSQVAVILLHVVTLNTIVTENRILEELGREARLYLEKLASSCLRSDIASQIRIRLGKAAEEILAQARDDQPDLIILPIVRGSSEREPSGQSRESPAPIISALARKVIDGANCDVMVIPFNAHFDCENTWGRPIIATGNDEIVLHRIASPTAMSSV
jgi:nucleotide-binding universal stress UspA family protein